MTRAQVHLTLALGLTATLLVAAPAVGQSGGAYVLRRSVIAGGGETFSDSTQYRVGGTIGQADAGLPLRGGGYEITGGFWPGVTGIGAATPTPTNVLQTPMPTVSMTRTATRTATGAASSTPTSTTPVPPTVTPTAPPTGPTSTMGSPTSSPTATATSPSLCVGDCDSSGAVAVNELVVGVNISLELQPVDSCPRFDANDSDTVTVDELIRAVNNALRGCS